MVPICWHDQWKPMHLCIKFSAQNYRMLSNYIQTYHFTWHCENLTFGHIKIMNSNDSRHLNTIILNKIWLTSNYAIHTCISCPKLAELHCDKASSSYSQKNQFTYVLSELYVPYRFLLPILKESEYCAILCINFLLPLHHPINFYQVLY